MRNTIVVVLVAVLFGCGGSGGGGGGSAGPPVPVPLENIVDSYFPLEPGFHWTYAMSCDDPNIKLSTLTGVVFDASFDREYVEPDGSTSTWHYEGRGIRWTANGSYLFTYRGAPYWVNCAIEVGDSYEIVDDVEVWWQNSVATITLTFNDLSAVTTVSVTPYVWEGANESEWKRWASVRLLKNQFAPLTANVGDYQDYSLQVTTIATYSWNEELSTHDTATYDYQTQATVLPADTFTWGPYLYDAVSVRRWGVAPFIGSDRTYVRGIGPILTDRLDVEEGIELSSGIRLALVDFGR
jgi:hypothetical protein